MPRLTAEALMAPGGLLDAGSRLTQTLINVPFQREQFRAGLDEKALMIKREDDRISKNEKVGYLKDRISATQQRIAELRRAMMLGDKSEAMLALKSLGKSGGAGGSSKAVLDVAARVGEHEAKLREEGKTKLGAKFATAETEDDIRRAVEKFEREEIARVKRLGLWPEEADASLAAMGGSLKGIDLDMIKADPQLQVELDATLDQQSQLFDQYRELVGHAQDVVETRAFLSRSMPGLAPQGQARGQQPSALGPPGSNPEDYQNLPPQVTLPYGKDGGADAYKTAIDRLDSPDMLTTLAGSANPAQQDVLVQQQMDGSPKLNAELTALGTNLDMANQSGMPPQEVDKIKGVMDQKLAAKTATVRNALTAMSFNNQITPETLAATDKILATVQPPGIELLWKEITGTADAKKHAGVEPGAASGPMYDPGVYGGPKMSPHLIPRVQALKPPGVVSAEQSRQQQQVRTSLSSQGLYPR